MALKFKTFRNLVITGAALVGLGGYLAYTKLRSPVPRAHPSAGSSAAPDEVPAAAQAELARARAAVGKVQGNRDPYADPMLEAILARIPSGVAGDKAKDVFPSAPYKVNLYGEGGLVTRLKVDLDRDEKWDEKWTLATPGEVEGLKRQVSEGDDEVYEREYLLRGGAFQLQGAEAADPDPDPDSGSGESGPPAGPRDAASSPQAAPGELAPHERRLIERIQEGIGGPGAKLKDPWQDGPKVNVYHDKGQSLPNRAKLDLDRDEKWDEKWTFEQTPEGLKIKRQVSSADDDTLYDREYRLTQGRWVEKTPD